ncbi:hypothetical protein RAZWK3B_14319 [Roseobacter sp. AzwK-3b]|uniref:thioredoxin family protein n=1 Tax=Roseobacter sp. AzwK-3b TaxID=351016 RepID=UPI0001569D48|nr:thioredoxin family protein [Roseobacter sp. AzwK-3b]EDM71403.1 hypothetical protein RAZWK3B_14319 [Roseobacter sp. AzwK-3b]
MPLPLIRPLAWLGLPFAAGLFLWVSAASAQTDFRELTPTERAVFHSQIREALLGLPRHILPNAPAPALDIMGDAIAQDLSRLTDSRSALFSPDLPGFGPADAALTVALFTAPDCPECAAAEADLRRLTETRDLRVTLLDIDTHRDLAQALEIDLAPSYVLPDMMLRGHIPMIVMERYLPQ